MLRRTPFKQPAKPERKPVAWPGPQAFAPANRCDGVGAAQPKRTYIRSKALLAAVRTLPCQHSGVVGRTEAAHSNWPQHGKAKGIKADDNRIAALSADIHRELDQGKNWSSGERQAIWWLAHCRTVRALLAAGLWPANVPIPDLRSFDA
jgi:hypothetical protein